VTPNFTLAELTITNHRSLDNTPDPASRANLQRLAVFLELVKDRLGGRAVMASGLAYDQLIREFDAWTHISIPNTPTAAPRKSALIIDRAGTRAFA